VAIEFPCPHCRKTLKAPESLAGRQGGCRYCRARVTVPVPAATPSPEPETQPAHAGPIAATNRPSPKYEDLVDMTAMVDIVFFLLIFFMVTSMQAVSSSISLPPPDPQKISSQGQRTVASFESDENFVIIRIEDDDSVWLEGAEIPSEQELRSRLRAMKKSARGVNKILVLANGDAHQVTAVMVLDAGNDIGVEDIRLAIVDDVDM
jgi:biopolymer transport protein ExbD